MNTANASPFRCFIDVPIRYSDIDAQGHLNNAASFAFMEDARVSYLREIGLWSGRDFESIGLILATATCAYESPAYLCETVRTWIRVYHLGHKSFRFEYVLTAHGSRSHEEGRTIATGQSIQVCYDYARQASIPMPEAWREAITAYEPALNGTGTMTEVHSAVASTGSGSSDPSTFRFRVGLPIRYADIDAQRHLNNVAYIRFMEHAQVFYLRELGLWGGEDYGEIGMIVAEASCVYLEPAYLGEVVTVRARVSYLGTKSFRFEYGLEVERGAAVHEIARINSVQVCYDYGMRRSISMPSAWRTAIVAYEPALVVT